jgi:large exoprotein involved in heme utilization and adhesion
LSTSGGDIQVELPADFNASMELSTSGGDVNCNLSLNNATKLSGHKIVADLNNGGMDFSVHTSGGDIDVIKK